MLVDKNTSLNIHWCVCVCICVPAYHSACVDIRGVVYLKMRQEKDAALQSSRGRVLLGKGNIKRGGDRTAEEKRGGRQLEKRAQRKRLGIGRALFKGDSVNVHSGCSQWLQLRRYPVRTPRAGQ